MPVAGSAHPLWLAAPDGYTLMLDASSFAVNPALFPRLPYDSDKAFRPVGVIALFPNVLLVNPSVPAASVKELVALAKAKKNGVSYASSGNGSAQHLAGAMFESAAGVDMLHVPYKGGAPALNDVIGARCRCSSATSPPRCNTQAGKLKPLAVTSAAGRRFFPAVPTMAEAGVAGYEVYEWNVLFAPAGTSEAIIGKLAAALQKTLDARREGTHCPARRRNPDRKARRGAAVRPPADHTLGQARS